jgi:hypothetical protein
MSNVKRQKAFGVVFCLVAVLLVADRLFILPRGAAAREGGSEAYAASTLMLNTVDDSLTPTETQGIVERLATLCPSERILDGTLPDAFSLPAPWLAEVDPNGSLLGRSDRIAEFKNRYELLAVAGNNGSPCAFINHHRLHAGQSLEGFTLVDVDDRSATFEDGGLRFVLRLRAHK